MKIPRVLVAIICVVPWIGAVAGIGALAYLRYPPSGVFTVESFVDGKSPWIFPFLPSERVSSPGAQPEGWYGQRITADPAYASIRVPGPYDSADVAVEYRVNHQPLLELGVTQSADSAQATMLPMYSSELNQESWRRVTSGQETGFVRNDVRADRLEQSDAAGLAVWNATARMPLLSDPPMDATTTDISLRGSHDFYLVPSGGKIDATLVYQIANRKEGTDVVAFRVYRGEEELPDLAYTLSLSNEQQMGKPQSRHVVVEHADPGVYRIAVFIPDDVFIRSIHTTSKHWVVGPRVYAGDTVGYLANSVPFHGWTNSRHLVTETFHKEGLQNVVFGSLTGRLQRTHATLRLDRTDDASIVELSAPNGDIRFVLDGFVAFRQEAFFEPKPKRLTDATRLGPEKIEAVLTSYVPPDVLSDGWLRSTFRIPLQQQTDTLKVTLSAPGLMSRTGSVDIRKISVTYHRKAGTWQDWMKILHQELANAWHRL